MTISDSVISSPFTLVTIIIFLSVSVITLHRTCLPFLVSYNGLSSFGGPRYLKCIPSAAPRPPCWVTPSRAALSTDQRGRRTGRACACHHGHQLGTRNRRRPDREDGVVCAPPGGTTRPGQLGSLEAREVTPTRTASGPSLDHGQGSERGRGRPAGSFLWTG